MAYFEKFSTLKISDISCMHIATFLQSVAYESEVEKS